MEKDILKILNKISKRSKIKESTNIIKSKIFDSLDLINLIFELEEFYNIKFNDKDLQDKNFNKLNNIKNIIVKKIKK
tara:strand:- start:12 stop:242 length:231 start_codon:yes stop_codon:yes gene_type:complete